MSLLLQDQSVVLLQSMASKQNLQSVNGGGVAGRGKRGKFAKWIVHRESGGVRFQNMANRKFLRVIKQKLDCDGARGQYTLFRVIDHKVPGVISLESNAHRGQHVGILPNGDAKAPHHTQLGEHGQFMVHALTGRIIQPQPQIIITQQPQVFHPPPQVIVQQPPPTIIVQQQWDHKTVFVNGSVIELTSMATGQNLRIHPNGTVDGHGAHGPLAKFVIHHVDHHGHIRLSSFADRKRYLRIQPNGELDGNGGEGPYTIFRVKPQGHGVVCFESHASPGFHVGILPNGSAKNGKQTGDGQHGQFKVTQVR